MQVMALQWSLARADLVGLVPWSNAEAKLFLQISQHPTNETTAVQEERRVVGWSYRRRMEQG